MCTLSVVTRENGYCIAMNRDERIVRGAGTPAEKHEFGGTQAVYPGDGAGGTWIAANEHGVALALLNWNDVVPRRVDPSEARSRGRLIPALIDTRSLTELRAVLDMLDLEGMLPFVLVGVFPADREIWEWRWNSSSLESRVHEWQPRHWFSSSLSDLKAQSLRGKLCNEAWAEPDAGSVAWLRRLHTSHAGGPGPFSVCVHREDVKTLSYTELACTPKAVQCVHFVGNPCTMDDPGAVIEIHRSASVVVPAGRLDSSAIV
jgi:transport and Golgi organization protein 2